MKQSDMENILKQILSRMEGLSRCRSTGTVGQSINGTDNIQAGRDVTVINGDIVLNFNNDLSSKEQELINLIRERDNEGEWILRAISELKTLAHQHRHNNC